jgi:subtilase family serine protease
VHSLLKPAAFLLTLGVALSAFPQAKASDRILQAIDDRETRQLRGNLHPLLQHAADQGRMDGGFQMEGVSLVFKRTPAQEADVEKLLADQQNPASPSYHRWLTPEQYADRFGLSKADVAKVVAWLQAEGFTVNRVARGRTQVWFTGSVSHIETAFRTEMHHYLVNAETHFANGVQPAVPAALADVVLGVHNLNDFRPRSRARVRKPSVDATVKANLTSSLSGFHFLIPDDFATIYDVKALYTAGFDGSGQKIAIAGQSAVTNSDIDAFRAAAGLPARTATNFVPTLVPNTGTSVVSCSSTSCDASESTLDLEWAEGVAKGATEIFVYTGNSGTANVFDAFTYAIDQNLAPVISMSYGNCEQNLPASFLTSIQQKTQQANLQGQTIAAASGDFGVADCDSSSTLPAQGGLGVDIPGSLPYVTSVGGSTFTGDAAATVSGSCAAATPYWAASCSPTSGGSALQYIPETSWNDTTNPQVNALSASGGGASVLFSKPSWQTGTGVPSDGQRDVPDVALAASPNHDGYLLCFSGSCVNGFRDNTANTGFNVAGGTSFGAPTFAGIVAILNQKTHSSQGNVNPTLYALAASTPSAFHDITSGNNIVPCGAGTPNCPTTGTAQYGYTAGTGYDLVTGLGSIDANVLVNNWTSGNPTAADFELFGNVVSIATPGGSGTSTVTANARNGYSGTLNFTCTAPTSALIGCSISGSPVTLGGATPSATVTVTVTTTHAALDHSNAPLWFASSGASLAGVFVFGIPARRRRWPVALTLLTLALLAAAVGCGGSSSSSPKSSGTPVGSYTVSVTASDGTTSHATNVAVAVK